MHAIENRTASLCGAALRAALRLLEHVPGKEGPDAGT